ncbi:MAG: ATP-binding cassette domain-containing protein [Actinomycetota bacterium]
MTGPSVVVRSVTHHYGLGRSDDRLALWVDDLTIGPGTTAVLGPNGAGKSTFLRLLATVSSAQAGTIWIGGRDVADQASCTEIRRKLGYAMQPERLPERMRVDAFCDYIAALKEIGPRRRRRRWVDWILHDAGLIDVRRDRIGALSGGMRRRLINAQAFLGRPDLVVLDEPLVSLDAQHRADLIRAIAASAATRSTIVATHHADELASTCRSVIVLAAGRVVFQGTPHELAGCGNGRTWETTVPIDHPSARAVGPDRFRIVDHQPPQAAPAEPSVHDGYVAVVNDSARLP